MKAYSVNFREKIVSAIKKGDSSVEKVAQCFGVGKNCVQKLVTQKGFPDPNSNQVPLSTHTSVRT